MTRPFFIEPKDYSVPCPLPRGFLPRHKLTYKFTHVKREVNLKVNICQVVLSAKIRIVADLSLEREVIGEYKRGCLSLYRTGSI